MPAKGLVVVESPTKIKTVSKYLGDDYRVAATVGHIVDLPPKELGVDIHGGFIPEYRVLEDKKQVVASLKSKADGIEDIYLAADPDREGEAIAYHAMSVLKKSGRRFHRVLFHELTKDGIAKGMAQTSEIDMDRFEAQQTRRILDRIVGYKASPLLWRKLAADGQVGLSAGRVQSVALRIICDRDFQISSFKPEEYWAVIAHINSEDCDAFTAKLVKKGEEKIIIPDKQAADVILSELDGQDLKVVSVEKKPSSKKPQPPFTTSKLQQDAISKLKFSAKKVMSVAQQLYEGVELGGEGRTGLITYLRSDSLRSSPEAQQAAANLIKERYGDDYALGKPREFKNKDKIQDAHEAIRPTDVFRLPDDIKEHLTDDQYKLYRLVWQRFVASQTADARVTRTVVTLAAADYVFAATGSVIEFDGWMQVYMAAGEGDDEKTKLLPPLQEGQIADLDKYEPLQHFTKPPPLFTEASLVRRLEKKGIGRPSTYASILSTIKTKNYVELNKGKFFPSEQGKKINALLSKNFNKIFEVDFTADMEARLDKIEAKKSNRVDVLKEFYDEFAADLDKAMATIEDLKKPDETTDIKCPKCNSNLVVRKGKNGEFLSCPKYPECKHAANFERTEDGIKMIERKAPETTDIKCDKCQKPMVKRSGKHGEFLSCSGYPKCKNTMSCESEN